MNEQSEKREWISPEIVDLDVIETAGAKGGTTGETHTEDGPS